MRLIVPTYLPTRFYLWCGLLIFIITTMIGCVHVPNMNLPINTIPQVFTGRFSISYLKNGEIAREQGSFEWKLAKLLPITKVPTQIPVPTQIVSMQLSLLGAFNNTLALLALDMQSPLSSRATLRTPTQTFYADNLDNLMLNILGWQLPLNALLPWLGTASPKNSFDGWDIMVVSRYASNFPKIITANHKGMKLTVRLVFEEGAFLKNYSNFNQLNN